MKYVALIFVFTLAACQTGDMTERQAEVAERGTVVMPFDLERTTHIFQKTETGGVQQVLSDDGDSEQIAAIQEHLEEEAGKFSQGNFHDPAIIHGHDMPGLHTLAMGHERLEITYSSLGNGGQIVYASSDSSLISALYDWFDAQVADHGPHAHSGH